MPPRRHVSVRNDKGGKLGGANITKPSLYLESGKKGKKSKRKVHNTSEQSCLLEERGGTNNNSRQRHSKGGKGGTTRLLGVEESGRKIALPTHSLRCARGRISGGKINAKHHYTVIITLSKEI